MDKDQFFLVSSLIMEAARMAGFIDSPNRSGFDGGYGTVWSWRWMDAPDSIIAGVEVSVLPDDYGEGAEIKVSSTAYDYKDRANYDFSHSRLYWGRYIEYKYLVPEKNMEDVASEMKEGLNHAWQDLPQQVVLLPQKVERMRALKENLRNMGLLQE